MRRLLLILLIAPLLVGCARNNGFTAPTTDLRTFTSKQPCYFSITYEPARLAPRIRNFPAGSKFVMASFYDRDPLDRPVGLGSTRRGDLTVYAFRFSGSPWSAKAARKWLAHTEGLSRANAKSPVSGSMSRVIFKGLHGWRVQIAWKLATETDWYLYHGTVGYLVSMCVARSATPQARLAFDKALRSISLSHGT